MCKLNVMKVLHYERIKSATVNMNCINSEDCINFMLSEYKVLLYERTKSDTICNNMHSISFE